MDAVGELSVITDDILELQEQLRTEKAQRVSEKERALQDAAKAQHKEVSHINLQARRKLMGHYGKIYAFAWGPDSQNIVSASQDGNMFVWNAVYGLRVQGITLESEWVMGCGYSPDGRLVCTGGLDNVVWLFKVQEGMTSKTDGVLVGHEGYISSCTFTSPEAMITTSGDTTAAYWDISTSKIVQSFTEHSADVSCSAAYDTNLVVTGSCDLTTKVWDIRTGNKSVRTYYGQGSDVNDVAFFPDGNAVVAGCGDSSTWMFDLRSYSAVASYKSPEHPAEVTGVDVSKSGRYLFTSYAKGAAVVWDTLFCEPVSYLNDHDKRVSKVKVSPDGTAVATCSWDASVIVWA